MAEEKYKVGDRFNSWTLLKKLPTKNHTRFWQCVCDCGATKTLAAGNVTSGKSKNCHSCGIKKREAAYWASMS